MGKSGVKSFPTEKYFYDVEGIGEHKQIIEKCFSKIEGEFSSLLREVLNLIVIDANDRKTTFVQLSSKQKDAFSAQLAVQKTRTRAFRDYYKGIYRHLKEKFPLVDIPLYDETDFQRLHISEILCSKMSNFYSNLFDDRHWVFLINYTEMQFLISDNPVIIIDNRREKGETLSPVSDKATFYFPISPNVAIEIYDKNVQKNDLGYFDICLV